MRTKQFVGLFCELYASITDAELLESKNRKEVKFFKIPGREHLMPLFIGGNGLAIIEHTVSRERRAELRKTRSGRLMALHPSGLQKVTCTGEIEEYPRSFFISSKEINGFLAHTIRNWTDSFFQGSMARAKNKRRIAEAYFVSYICHEIRHDLQFERFVTEDGARFRDGSENHLLGQEEWTRKPLINSWIPEDIFRSVLAQWYQEQKKHYISYLEKCYDDYSFTFAIEDDALCVQVLAFDCWLSDLPHSQKLSRIKEIVRIFREL